MPRFPIAPHTVAVDNEGGSWSKRMITETEWTDEETQRALGIWEEYQKAHDVSTWIGKAVGIDPKSGRLWFGEDARDVARQARADGVTSRLLGLRVGEDFYLRKGGSAR